ncbi:hypothetical protein [Micromonospora sp. WMMD1274]|uniref:hypothetical protein n=1 Tax=Micromonospora sp. WMMD1274 TaxID=3404116 RepID=UPI003B96754F
MIVREFEGWLADLLAAQPWVRQVSRWSTGGGPKPVGVTLNGRIDIQLVGGDQKAPPLDPDNAGTASPVEATPGQPPAWADAIVAAISAAGLPRVAVAETYAQWGGSSKPAGMRVQFTDGSEVFGTVLNASL